MPWPFSWHLTYSLLHHILCPLWLGGMSFLFALLSSDMCQAAVSDTNQEPLHSSLKMLAKRWGLTVQVLHNKRPHYWHLLSRWGVVGLWAAAEEVESSETDFIVSRSESKLEGFKCWACLQRPGWATCCGSIAAHDAGPGTEVARGVQVERG